MLQRKSLFWAALVMVLVVRGAREWYSIDNHQYLLIYWAVAIMLAVRVAAQHFAIVLGRTAVLMIGSVMLLATAQKAQSPEFRSGSFFEYTFLTDDRFEPLTFWTTGLPRGTAQAHTKMMNRFKEPATSSDDRPQRLQLTSNNRIRQASIVLTWLTLLMEGTVAALFLFPFRSRRMLIVRNVSMILFIMATYPIAPVIGFGWLLISMGLAQCPREFVLLRTAYITLFLLLPLFTVSTSRLYGVLQRLS
jgi:hypothetical protein